MDNKVKVLFVMLSMLLFLHFFGAISVKNNYLTALLLPFLIDGVINKNAFGKYILVIIFGLFCSALSSYYFREQSLVDSFYLIVPYFFIGFYFILLRFNISIIHCEAIIIFLTVTFCLCYILQYSIYPVEIFHGATERSDVDPDTRIRMIGQGFSSLGYFLGLNKFILKKKIQYLLLSILCISVIILMGFRTMSIVLVLFTFVLIVRLNGFNVKMLIYGGLAILVLGLLFQIDIFSSIVNRMIERNETQNFSNDDYLRNIQFRYFTQEHFMSGIEYFFGSGLPAYGSSQYGRYMYGLIGSNINYVDLGLLSLSWMIGIIPVGTMILYSIKAARQKVGNNYYYISNWFVYLLAISITTMEFFRSGNFIVQAICLYMVDVLSRKS